MATEITTTQPTTQPAAATSGDVVMQLAQAMEFSVDLAEDGTDIPPAPPAGPPSLTLEISESNKSGRSGYISFNDVDGSGYAELIPLQYRPSPLGSFTLAAPDAEGFSAWSYTPGRGLDAGESATDSYLVKDKNGASYQINVHVQGQDDPSVIDGDLKGTIVEGVTNKQSGTLFVHDADLGDAVTKPAGTHLLAYNGEQGKYGTFNFNGTGTGSGATNAANWTYTLTNDQALLDQLNTGQKVVESFEVLSSDGQSETIEITLHGEDDPAIFGGAQADSSTAGVQAEGSLLSAGRSFTISTDAAADAVDRAFSLGDDMVAQAISHADAIAIEHDGSLDAILGSDAPGLLNLVSRHGGLVNVGADAQASADGLLAGVAEADAHAGGLRNINVFTDGHGDITLGVDAHAQAMADGDVVIELKADADAYGVQGTGDDDHYVSIVGNPFADVAAKSLLVGNDNEETKVGGLSANAVGLQHLAVSSVGDTNHIGASVEASIGAKDLGSNVSSDLYSITIGASAIGVDDVLVRTNGHDQAHVSGSAALRADLSGWDHFDAGAIDQLNSFGIRASNITTSTGNDRVEGHATSDINQFELYLDSSDLAVNGGGVVDSSINTGSGNDQVIGTASGDGLRAAQGFVNTHVNTGTGNDVVSGGASGSNFLMGLGDDAVTLVASEGSVLDGGIGNDNLRVTGASSTTRLDGGIGKDQLQGGSGADDLSGGIGSDVIRGGAGADRFHFTGADMLTGTDKLVDFNGSEGDKLMLSSNLTGFEKGTAVNFVTAAQAQQAGFNMDQAVIVDSMANIQAMGSVSHSHLAYATDTGALLYDANGDWSQGSRTVAVLNDNGKNANLTAANIEIS